MGAEDAESGVGIAAVPSSEGAAGLDFNTRLLHSAHVECRAVEQDWEEPAMEQGIILRSHFLDAWMAPL